MKSSTKSAGEVSGTSTYDSRFSKENILRILCKIYTRSISADFRRPVVTMYPDLAQTYKAVVREPMDLGTVLLRVYRGQEDILEIKRCLKLICSNALTFNQGAHIIESIANHVNVFAKYLWEEVFITPFSSDVASIQFQFIAQRIASRRDRFAFVMHEMLHPTELAALAEIFEELEASEAFVEIAKKVSEGIRRALDSAEPLTLVQALDPLYVEIMNGNLNRVVPRPVATANLPSLMCGCGLDNASGLSDNAIMFITAIDEQLGEFLASLCERKLRGAPGSSIWACPWRLLWAQPVTLPPRRSCCYTDLICFLTVQDSLVALYGACG